MSEILALIWLPGLAMCVLVGMSAIFSGSETAFFYLSHEELRAMRLGTSSERAAAALLAQPDRLLTAILFWNLLINMTYFSVSVVVASRLAQSGHAAVAGGFGVVSLGLIILLGEVAPKSVAVVFRKRIAIMMAWPIALGVRVVDPVAPPLAALTAALRRAFWPDLVSEPILDANDLERAVDASSMSREVVQKERQVLHNVLDFSEIRLEEAMRPRGSYRVMSAPVTIEALRLSAMPPGGLIAIRVADSDDVDRVILLNELTSFPRELEAASVPLIHLPWCASLADALQHVRRHGAAGVDVVNEHGETIGLLTRDDLLDALLMPEADRAKRLLRRDPILEIAPEVFHVEGITTLRHLAARLGLEDYEPDDEENVTVAGLLVEELEHLPEVGEAIDWRGFEFKVIDVSDRTVRRILVERKNQEEEVMYEI